MFSPATGHSEDRQALIALVLSAVLVAAVSFGARVLIKGRFHASAAAEATTAVMEGVVR